MKKLLVVIAIAAAATGTVQAQPLAPPPAAPKAPAAAPRAPSVARKSQAPAAPAAPAAPQPDAAQGNAPAPPGWAARCASPSRDAPLECAVEQNAIFAKTGQTVVLVNIRVPGDTRAPLALIQLPLGINVQAGSRIQVDEGKTFDFPIQTCEQRGCFITGPVAPDLIAAMRSGKQIKVSFQTMQKETVTVPLALAAFPAAYDKIK